MKLITQKGDLLIIKQTMHEADHSKRGFLVIIKEARHEANLLKGSFGNYKADEACT